MLILLRMIVIILIVTATFIGLLSVSKTILSRTVHSYIKENIISPPV